MTCKHEHDCKGYTPKPKKEKLPVIKVEAWYWHDDDIAKHGGRNGAVLQRRLSPCLYYDWYKLTGNPDWERIIRETFGEGAEVVRVTPVKGRCKHFELSHYTGGMAVLSNKNILPIKYQKVLDVYYFYPFDGVYSDADIESAIREHHKADAPQSAHKNGEMFEGMIRDGETLPAKHHLVYRGETRPPIAGEYAVMMDGAAHKVESSFSIGSNREILTLVPDEPEPKYKVGNIVYVNDRGDRICKVLKAEDGRVKLDRYNTWISTDHIRPAVPADFERTVGNMKVRAYETDSYLAILGSVLLKWSDGSDAFVNSKVATAYGYPIIPLSVSGGKFEAPK